MALNSIFDVGIALGTQPGARPLDMARIDFINASRAWTSFGIKLSVAGAIIESFKVLNNPSGGNAVDAVFAIVGVIPGAGTVIGSIYFGADFITWGVTGQSISEHIDNYIWIPNPAGIGFIPVTKIPGR